MAIDLPQPLKLMDYEVGLASLFLYYSWGNVSSNYANNAYSIIFDGTTYPITMPNGLYTIQDIQGFLEFQMNLDGLFLLDENDNPVYFIRLEENPVYYAFTLTCTPIPTVLPAGWSNPNGITLSGETPQLIVPSTVSADGKTSFGILIGFNPGTYPAAPDTSIYQVNSITAPQISPVSSVSVIGNFVAPSLFSLTPSSLYDFSSDVAYGSLMSLIPNPIIYYPATDGSYSRLILELVDQDNRPIPIIDPVLYAKLIFRKRDRSVNQSGTF